MEVEESVKFDMGPGNVWGRSRRRLFLIEGDHSWFVRVDSVHRWVHRGGSNVVTR